MQDDDLIGNFNELLERVDEYTLYCFYLGYAPEIDMAYCSPIRADDVHPSWSLYVSKKVANRAFMWKDKGGKGISGDVFKLVKLLYGYTSNWQVMERIKSDFGMGPLVEAPGRVFRVSPPTVPAGIDIRVKSRVWDRFDLKWWADNWNVSRPILDRYRTSPIRYYFTRVDQSQPSFTKNPAYAYLIMGKYQLYFPFERKEFRFRNDLTDRELGGFEQLTDDRRLLIITKSLKDVMCLRSFGYNAVCCRGESTIIPPNFLQHFEERFDNIVVLFDNDGKHKAEAYPYPKIWVPISSGTKDITDFNKAFRPPETGKLLHQLTAPWAQSA